MSKFQKLKSLEPIKLNETIKIKEFQVSSMLISKMENARLSLVSMGKDEEISAETMPWARYFFVVAGEIEVKLENTLIRVSKEKIVYLPENSFYSVHGKTGSIYLEIEFKGGKFMSEVKTIQHIARAKTFLLKEEISYEKGQVTSKNLVTNSSMVMTIMALDKGESLAPHKAPGDAFITVLDGKAKFFIEDKENIVSAGENILLPGNILHGVEATEAFKMLLIIAK